MSDIKHKYLVDEQGNKISIVLSIEEYNELLENLHDLEVIAGRRDEQTMSLKDLKDSLSNNDTI